MQANQVLWTTLDGMFKDLNDVPKAVENFKSLFEAFKFDAYSAFVRYAFSSMCSAQHVPPNAPLLQLFFQVSRYVLKTMDACQHYLHTIYHFIAGSQASKPTMQRIIDILKQDDQIPNVGIITEYVCLALPLPDFNAQNPSDQAMMAITNIRSQEEVLAYLLFVLYKHNTSYGQQCVELLKNYSARGIQPTPYLSSILKQAMSYQLSMNQMNVSQMSMNYHVQPGMSVPMQSAYAQIGTQFSGTNIMHRAVQCTPQFSQAMATKDLCSILLSLGPVAMNDLRILQYVLNMCHPITTVKLASLIIALSLNAADPRKHINPQNVKFFAYHILPRSDNPSYWEDLMVKYNYTQYHVNALFSLLKNSKVEVQWNDILGLLEQHVAVFDGTIAQTIITAYIGYYIDSTPSLCLCANCASTFNLSVSNTNSGRPGPLHSPQAIEKPVTAPSFNLFDYMLKDKDHNPDSPYFFEASFLAGLILYYYQLIRAFNKTFLSEVIAYYKADKELPAALEQNYLSYRKVFFVLSQITSSRVVIEKGNIQVVTSLCPILQAIDTLYYMFKPHTNFSSHACLSKKKMQFKPEHLEQVYDVLNPATIMHSSPSQSPQQANFTYGTRASKPEAWVWSSASLVKALFRIYPLVPVQLRSLLNDILGISSNRTQSIPDPITRCPEQFLITLAYVDLSILPILHDNDRQLQLKRYIEPIRMIVKPQDLLTKATLRMCATFLLQRYLFKAAKQQVQQGYVDAIVATNVDLVLFTCELLWRNNHNGMGKILDLVQDLRLIEPLVRTWRSFEFVCDAAAFAAGREFLNPAIFIINSMQTYGRVFAEEFLTFILKKYFRTLCNIDGKSLQDLCAILTEKDVQLCSMILLPYAGNPAKCRSKTVGEINSTVLEALDILTKNNYQTPAAKHHLLKLLTEPLVITAQGSNLQMYQDMNFLLVSLMATLPATYNQYRLRSDQHMLSSSPITEAMQIVFFKFLCVYKEYFSEVFPADNYLQSLFDLVKKVTKHCLPKVSVIEQNPMGVFFSPDIIEQNVWIESQTVLQNYFHGTVSAAEVMSLASAKQRGSCTALGYQISYCVLMHTIIDLLAVPEKCAELINVGKEETSQIIQADRDTDGILPETALLKAELALASLAGVLLGSGVLTDVFVPRLCTVVIRHLNSSKVFYNEVAFEVLYKFYIAIATHDKDTSRASLLKRWVATFSHILKTRHFAKLAEQKYSTLSEDKQTFCKVLAAECESIVEEAPIEETIAKLANDKRLMNYDVRTIYNIFSAGGSLSSGQVAHVAPLQGSRDQELATHQVHQAHQIHHSHQDQYIQIQHTQQMQHIFTQKYISYFIMRNTKYIPQAIIETLKELSSFVPKLGGDVLGSFMRTFLKLNPGNLEQAYSEITLQIQTDGTKKLPFAYFVTFLLLLTKTSAGSAHTYNLMSSQDGDPQLQLPTVTEVKAYMFNRDLAEHIGQLYIVCEKVMKAVDSRPTETGEKLRTVFMRYALALLLFLIDSEQESPESLATQGEGNISETGASRRTPGFNKAAQRQAQTLLAGYRKVIVLGHWLGIMLLNMGGPPAKQEIDFLRIIEMSLHTGNLVLVTIFFVSLFWHSLDSPSVPATSGFVVVVMSKLYDTIHKADESATGYSAEQIELANAVIAIFQSAAYTCLDPETSGQYTHDIVHNTSLQGLFASSETIPLTQHQTGQLQPIRGNATAVAGALKPAPFEFVDPLAEKRKEASEKSINYTPCLKTAFDILKNTRRYKYAIPSQIFRSEFNVGVLREIQQTAKAHKVPIPLILSFLAANPALHSFLERAVQIVCNMPELNEAKKRACGHARNLIGILVQESALNDHSRGASTASTASVKSQTGLSTARRSKVLTLDSKTLTKESTAEENSPDLQHIATTYLASSLFRASIYSAICAKIRMLLSETFYWNADAAQPYSSAQEMQQLLNDTVIEALVYLTAECALNTLNTQVQTLVDLLLATKRDHNIRFTDASNSMPQFYEDAECSDSLIQQRDSISLQQDGRRVETAFTTSSMPTFSDSFPHISTTSPGVFNQIISKQDISKSLVATYGGFIKSRDAQNNSAIFRKLTTLVAHNVTFLYPYTIRNNSFHFSVPYPYPSNQECAESTHTSPVSAVTVASTSSSSAKGYFRQNDIEAIMATVFGYKGAIINGKPLLANCPTDKAITDTSNMMNIRIVANRVAAHVSARFPQPKWASSRVVSNFVLSSYSQAAALFVAINKIVPLMPHLSISFTHTATGVYNKADMQMGLYNCLISLQQNMAQLTESGQADRTIDVYSLQMDHPILASIHALRASVAIHVRDISMNTRSAFVTTILTLGDWVLQPVSLDTSMGLFDCTTEWKTAFDTANAVQMSMVLPSKTDLQSIVFKDISYSEILEPLLNSFIKVASPSLKITDNKAVQPYFEYRSQQSQKNILEFLARSSAGMLSRMQQQFTEVDKGKFDLLKELPHICTHSAEDSFYYGLESTVPLAIFKILLTIALDLDITELGLKLLALVKQRLVATIAHAFLWDLYTIDVARLCGSSGSAGASDQLSDQFWFADMMAALCTNLVKCNIISDKVLDITISGAIKYIANFLNRHYTKKTSSSNKVYLSTVTSKLSSESGVYFATCCHNFSAGVAKIALNLCFTGSITWLPARCSTSSLPSMFHFFIETYINTIETIAFLQNPDNKELFVLANPLMPHTLDRLMYLCDLISISDTPSDVVEYTKLYRTLVTTGYNPFSAHGFSSDQSNFIQVFTKNSGSSDAASKFSVESQVMLQMACFEHLHTVVMTDMDLTQRSGPLPLSILAYKTIMNFLTVAIPQISDNMSKEDEYSLISHYLAQFNALGYFMGGAVSSLLVDAVLHKLLKRKQGTKLCTVASSLGIFIYYLIYGCPECDLLCSFNKSGVLAHFLGRLFRFTSYLSSFKYKNNDKLQGILNFRSLDLLPNIILRTDQGNTEPHETIIDSACIMLHRVLSVLFASLFNKASPIFCYRHNFIYVITHYLLYISPRYSILFSNLFLSIISKSPFIHAALSLQDLDFLPYHTFSLEYALYYAHSNVPALLVKPISPKEVEQVTEELSRELTAISASIGVETYASGSTSSRAAEKLRLNSFAQAHLLQMHPPIFIHDSICDGAGAGTGSSTNTNTSTSITATTTTTPGGATTTGATTIGGTGSASGTNNTNSTSANICLCASSSLIPNRFLVMQLVNPSWKHYLRLILVLIEYIQQTIQIQQQYNIDTIYNASSPFIKGVARLFDLINHDFPEFLSSYKMHLISNLPLNHKLLRSMVMMSSSLPRANYQIANSTDVDIIRDVKEIAYETPLAGFNPGLSAMRPAQLSAPEFSKHGTAAKPSTVLRARNINPAIVIHDCFIDKLQQSGALYIINDLVQLADKPKKHIDQINALITRLCDLFVTRAADQSDDKNHTFIYAFAYYSCTELLNCALKKPRMLGIPSEVVAFQLYDRLFQHQSMRDSYIKLMLHAFIIHLGEPNRTSYMFALLLKHLANSSSQIKRHLNDCMEETKCVVLPWAMRAIYVLLKESKAA